MIRTATSSFNGNLPLNDAQALNGATLSFRLLAVLAARKIGSTGKSLYDGLPVAAHCGTATVESLIASLEITLHRTGVPSRAA